MARVGWLPKNCIGQMTVSVVSGGAMLQNARELEHHELRARDGTIGQVQDFFFDDRHWTIRYLVVDTGTWLNSRKVLISPVAVQSVDVENRLISVGLTQKQVRDSPGIDTEQPVSREHEAALMQYYNWPAYWGAVGFPDVGFGVPVMPITPAPPNVGGASLLEQRGASATATETAPHVRDHHLRSVRAVTGHHIQASDGRIGQVDDFIVDDAMWKIHYLVVDTRNWWPGRKVVLSPQWIREVGWEEAKVHVDLTRAAVKSSPLYESVAQLTPEYSSRLHAHYGRPWHNGP